MKLLRHEFHLKTLACTLVIAAKNIRSLTQDKVGASCDDPFSKPIGPVHWAT